MEEVVRVIDSFPSSTTMIAGVLMGMLLLAFMYYLDEKHTRRQNRAHELEMEKYQGMTKDEAIAEMTTQVTDELARRRKKP